MYGEELEDEFSSDDDGVFDLQSFQNRIKSDDEITLNDDYSSYLKATPLKQQIKELKRYIRINIKKNIVTHSQSDKFNRELFKKYMTHNLGYQSKYDIKSPEEASKLIQKLYNSIRTTLNIQKEARNDLKKQL